MNSPTVSQKAGLHNLLEDFVSQSEWETYRFYIGKERPLNGKFGKFGVKPWL